MARYVSLCRRRPRAGWIFTCLALAGWLAPARMTAGENLLGYLKSAEPLPKGAYEGYQFVTSRDDKGTGTYHAIDYKTELEYGVTDRFMLSGAFKAMTLDTHGLIIDGYLPQEKRFGLKTSGLEVEGLYNFLSPARDDFGLSASLALDYDWIDKHSGQRKDTISTELTLLAQKYFREGEITWLGNFGIESTYAKRAAIAGLPDGFDWPTDPEMEIELKAGTGIAYRFAPRWYVGAETLYETEFETEVGQERWSVFAGPSLHYGSAKWWATLTYFPQITGGGEVFLDQTADLHLVEKTKEEVRVKIGLNF